MSAGHWFGFRIRPSVLLSLLAAFSIANCAPAGPGEPPPKERPVERPLYGGPMGFTPWPPDLTPEAVERVYAFIQGNANLVSHHLDNGVPWQEALEGAELPRHLRDDWQFRRARTPGGYKVLLSLTPLNFERTGLAPYWGEEGDNRPLPPDWARKPLDDPEVKRAFTNYVLRAVEHFRPDFLAIGIETNIMISKAPDRWTRYLALHRHVYAEVKRRHPALPSFATVQYEHLRGIEGEAKPNLRYQAPGVNDLMQHSDLLALSTYRYGLLHPNPAHDGYFDTARQFGKPIAVAESGAMSKDVRIGGLHLPANEADQHAFVALLLDQAARHRFAFVVNWVAIDFDRLLDKLPPDLAELSKAWVHTGLVTAEGREKPALALWRRHLAGGGR